MTALTRRALLCGLASATLPSAADAAQGLAAAARGVNPVLVARTLDALVRHDGAIWSRDVIGIADFGLPSWRPRFYLIDILAGTTTTMLLAHGRGSDPQHSGYLQSFSNAPGSLATSEGAYLAGEPYIGINGRSRRLIGLDPTNDQAERRAIVIHSARYVGSDVVARRRVLGRSDGCLAFSQGNIAEVLARLGRGRLIYAGRA